MGAPPGASGEHLVRDGMPEKLTRASSRKQSRKIDINHDGRCNSAHIREWSADRVQHARTFTTVAIAKLVGLVAADDAINENDASLLKDCLERQQNVWNVLLVIDTLIAAMALPLIIEDVHARGDVSRGLEMEDPALAGTFTQIYLFCTMLVFFSSCTHIGCVGILYVTTAYLTDYLDLLWFFVTFARTISVLNVWPIILCFFLLAGAASGVFLAYGKIMSNTCIVF